MDIMDGMNLFREKLSTWANMPGRISEEWGKFYRGLSPPLFSPLSFFKDRASLPFSSLNLYQGWMKLTGEAIKRVLQMVPGGVGPETLSRVFDGMKSYFAIYEFWGAWVKIMAAFRGKELSQEQWEDIHEKLTGEYRKVLDIVIGRKPPETMEEIMKLQGRMVGQGIELLSLLRTPWTTIVKQLPQSSTRALLGDMPAAREGFSLWQTAISDTIGKLLNIPSLGYSREHEERMKELADAYVKFAASLPTFYGEFYEAGVQSLDRLIERARDIPAENSPESFKKFYSLWIQVSEDTFYSLFKKEEFSNMMNEVMKKGLDFKKKLDRNVSKILENLSIPNREEIDDVYRTIHEMKKEVRQLSRDVGEIRENMKK